MAGLGLSAFRPVALAADGDSAATADLGYSCDLAGVSASRFQLATASLTPFERALVLPEVLAPRRSDATTDQYDVTMRVAEQAVVPGAGPTTIWGYEGTWPGPTIVARVDRTVEITQHNQLDVPTSIHLHGAHVPPDMDGHPNDLIDPRAAKLYRYHNDQLGATLWYHDHVEHATGHNVYQGLAALYLLLDELEEELGLPRFDPDPSLTRDVPLVIQDRSFQADGQLVPFDSYPGVSGHTGLLGDTIVVNGVPHPRFEVGRARYRFRMVNGSNARVYELALSDGAPLLQIATDGGLLPRPVRRSSIELYPAERAEVVIDFSAYAKGTEIVLENRTAGASGTLRQVLRFDVVRDEPDPSAALTPTTTLRPREDLPAPTVTRDLEFTLDDSGFWVIDGKRFDPQRVDQIVKHGAVERWRLHAPADLSPMSHPVHLHLIMFQVLARNGRPTPEWERGWKDTIPVHPGDTVEIVARFEGHTGTYVYHCHNLEHEDHDMMAQLQIVDLPRLGGLDRIETAATVSAAAFPDGAPVAFVATGQSFADALAGGPVAALRGGPVLLTGDRLPDATRAELQRLGPGEVIILGGERAVTGAVEADLAAAGDWHISRTGGDDRYGTAAALAMQHFGSGVTVAYVATGMDFADALAAGVPAALGGGPVLLVRPDAVPDATGQALRALQPQRLYVLGGTRAVSRDVEEQLRSSVAGPVDRLAGDDRYGTAAAVVRQTFTETGGTVYVASGVAFPDALAGVPAAARVKAPVLPVRPDAIPAAIATELRRLEPARIVLLGGPAAVSEQVERELADFLP